MCRPVPKFRRVRDFADYQDACVGAVRLSELQSSIAIPHQRAREKLRIAEAAIIRSAQPVGSASEAQGAKALDPITVDTKWRSSLQPAVYRNVESHRAEGAAELRSR